MSKEISFTALKKSSAEMLPASLYQQLEPYLESIHSHYQERHDYWQMVEEEEREELVWRYVGLENCFEFFFESSWVVFAQKNLPAIAALEDKDRENMDFLYRDAKVKFKDEFDLGWSEYARKRWPEIDQYYVLPDREPAKKIYKSTFEEFDDVPF